MPYRAFQQLPLRWRDLDAKFGIFATFSKDQIWIASWSRCPFVRLLGTFGAAERCRYLGWCSRVVAEYLSEGRSLFWNCETEGTEGLKCGDFNDCDRNGFLVSYEWIAKTCNAFLMCYVFSDNRVMNAYNLLTIQVSGSFLWFQHHAWLAKSVWQAQLLVIGPPADGFGFYAQRRLEALAEKEEFQGRLCAICQFMEAPRRMICAECGVAGWHFW